jgi:dienelactone hydrolase
MTREDILALLGSFPDPVPVEPEIIEGRDLETYTRYLVRYLVEAGEQVESYLLIPRGKGPFPAIVACHQHGDEYHVGKSEPVGVYENPANTFALTFCRQGFAVICPDNLGFEQRRPGPEQREKNPFLNNGKYERLLFMDYILKGSTLQAKYISDLCRAVDTLEKIPEVDSGRIGACGHSLGGLEAFWLAWYDARVKCAVSSCGFAQISVLQKMGINHNYAMYLPALLKFGDYSDILSDLCPKPAMLSFGREDILLPMPAVEEMIGKAHSAYKAAGYAECLTSLILEEGHIFSPGAQKKAVDFFEKWLNDG